MQRRSLIFLCLLVVFVIAPFLNKPFHIDDPYWVWTAQQIHQHPLDPFGYRINWFGHEQPAFQVAVAPPLFSYLLAAWAHFLGFSEISCHTFNLIIALLTVLGIYLLAIELGCDPFIGTWLSIISPVFLMSVSIVMGDLLMLMFWVGAFVLWLRALRSQRAALFLGAMLLACGSALSKYNGILLLPLLLLASLFEYRRLRWHLLWLLVPCGALALYLIGMSSLYHENFLASTTTYIETGRRFAQLNLPHVLTGGVFASACIGACFPLNLRGLQRRALGGLAIVVLLIEFLGPWRHQQSWEWTAQHMIWLFLGFCFMWSVGRAAWTHRDKTVALLIGWLAITIGFGTFVNWSINGRALVTLIPAVGLLMARLHPELTQWPRRRLIIFTLPILCISILVMKADADMAQVARQKAHEITNELRQISGDHTVWFCGHWGFQYYMQRGSAQPLDVFNSHVSAGDVLVLPLNNSNVGIINPAKVALIKRWTVSRGLPVAVMNVRAAAGYYTSNWGELPFVLGVVPSEDFYVFQIRESQAAINLF